MLFIGSVAPYSLRFRVTNVDGPDLNTSTAARVIARKPSGAEVTWAAARLGGATATAADYAHDFTEGELDEVGVHYAFLEIDTPSGTVRTQTQAFRVHPRI